ncbi:MAG TPA: glycoside hydrolase family 97 protein [archaeon]|nr:glycoside hydrolase family 97 protein [archaeon]
MLRRLVATWAVLLIFILALLSCGKYYSGGTITVKSPDSRIVLNFELKDLYDSLAVSNVYPFGINMYYNVSLDGKQVLTDSPLGMNFGNQGVVLGGLVIIGVTDSSGVDEFDTPFSKQAHVRVEYNQVTISLREKTIPAKTFDLIFRAYNDGIAFRYSFPEQEPKIKIPSAKHSGFLENFILVDELTGYYLPKDENAYSMFFPSLPHNYEDNYIKIRVSEISRDSIAALPFLILYEDGTAVCIAEANLNDYTASYLTAARNIQNGLTTVLWPLPGEKEGKVRGKVPFKTPWRVLMIADHPGKLIESNIILALSDPCALDDLSWIKPGKAAWDWWSGMVVEKRGKKVTTGGYDTKTYQHYIDFAHKAGLEYSLIDAGWYGAHRDPEEDITKPLPEVDMGYLVKYADSLGVKLLLWVNWENVKKQIDQAFPLYSQWGIAGVKVDYMDRDDMEMVQFYHDVVKKAAENHLVVDFHGAYRPTGMRRTWPNLLTREAVVGMEYSKWSDWCSPEHDVTIPYTRMLLGPMDYTPGAFNNATKKSFESRDLDPMSQGTRCHQLAMYVVYESPLQMLSDSPSNYRDGKGLDFLSMVPTVWDETRFIQGEVADYIVLARKKGDKWYLGAMTDWEARELEVPLQFLGGGTWKAKVWADGKKADTQAQDLEFSEKEVDSNGTLTVKMAPGGGLAAVFER